MPGAGAGEGRACAVGAHGAGGRGRDGMWTHAPGNSPQAWQRCTGRRAGGRKQTAGFKSLEKRATCPGDKVVTRLSVSVAAKVSYTG